MEGDTLLGQSSSARCVEHYVQLQLREELGPNSRWVCKEKQHLWRRSSDSSIVQHYGHRLNLRTAISCSGIPHACEWEVILRLIASYTGDRFLSSSSFSFQATNISTIRLPNRNKVHNKGCIGGKGANYSSHYAKDDHPTFLGQESRYFPPS